ncbi:MAG: hypothetical protein LBB94_05470 [Clostridiales bacterium]|nr:hypothetical protein [Clostridiales bacterium]
MSRRLEKSLQDSLRQLPRADLGIIINSDIPKAEQHDYITRQETNLSSDILGRITLMAVFSIIIITVISIWLIQDHSVYTMVTLDVNAGFIITADGKGNVLNVRGVDGVARVLLRDMDYTGVNIKELTGEIISISAEQRYLTEENPYILISVWDKDRQNAQKLLVNISERINNAAKSARVNPSVLGQYLELSDALERNAERFGVTAGRLQLIEALLKYKPAYTTEQLVKYNVESLLKIARAADVNLPVSGYRTVDVEPAAERRAPRDELLRIASKPDDNLPVIKVQKKEPTPVPIVTVPPAPTVKSPKITNTPKLEPPEPSPVHTGAIAEPEPAVPEQSVLPSESPESLWVSIASSYGDMGSRQLDFWRGNPDDQAQIDRAFDELLEKAAELGEEYKELGNRYREYYQSQYEAIMDEKEWTS